MTAKKELISNIIKKTAASLGFDYCGIAKAMHLPQDAKKLEAWLNNSFHGNMKYMENYFDMRVDPTKIVPGAKSVITLLKNYYPSQGPPATGLRISKYAWGNDYHEVIKKQLNEFLHTLSTEIGEIHGRGFVDSAPVLERTWANRSGLGWVGKNGNLINKSSGSFFFIATLITDLEAVYDDPFVKDYCGSCTKCIDACPTGAILPGKVIDGSRCISYYTIELKDSIPNEMKGKFDNWMFGCDTCQDVCPWNRFSQPHNELKFTPLPEILNFSTKDWEDLSEEQFKFIFKNSPLKRSKWKGILRNIKFLLSPENLTIEKKNGPSQSGL